MRGLLPKVLARLQPALQYTRSEPPHVQAPAQGTGKTARQRQRQRLPRAGAPTGWRRPAPGSALTPAPSESDLGRH
eukprot:14043735-Alexandrium_andersonii.AAC.1